MDPIDTVCDAIISGDTIEREKKTNIIYMYPICEWARTGMRFDDFFKYKFKLFLHDVYLVGYEETPTKKFRWCTETKHHHGICDAMRCDSTRRPSTGNRHICFAWLTVIWIIVDFCHIYGMWVVGWPWHQRAKGQSIEIGLCWICCETHFLCAGVLVCVCVYIYRVCDNIRPRGHITWLGKQIKKKELTPLHSLIISARHTIARTHVEIICTKRKSRTTTTTTKRGKQEEKEELYLSIQ